MLPNPPSGATQPLFQACTTLQEPGHARGQALCMLRASRFQRVRGGPACPAIGTPAYNAGITAARTMKNESNTRSTAWA